MNNVTTLQELNIDLEQKRSVTADYIADAKQMQYTDEALLLIKTPAGDKVYRPTKVASDQIASKLKIPAQYFQRMEREKPALLADNVNGWLRDLESNLFIRTYEQPTGNVFRAFLSEHYKVMDNYDVLHAFLNAIYESGQIVDVVQAQTTDSRLYVKVLGQFEADANNLLSTYRNPMTNTKDVIAKIGIEMTNSEVGKGAFQLMPFLYFNCCTNRLKIMDGRLRKIHLGGAYKDEGEQMEWSNKTKLLTEQLITSQVQDCVSQFLTPQYLEQSIQSFSELAEYKLQHPIAAVNNVTKFGNYSDERKEAVLDFFVRSGDRSAFGIIQALTFEAHTNEDADVVYDAENFAGAVVSKVISFDKKFSAN